MSGLIDKKNRKEVGEALHKKFEYKNSMEIPKLGKIVINMGIAEITKDKNAIQDCINELSMISGQKPITMNAKKSISNFKLREGQPIGLKVTLRKKRMMDFLHRFSNIVSPRIRDFRGFPLKLDGRGNYTLGIDDQQIFPEINLDNVKRTQGMNITFVTSAKNDEEGLELLSLLGIPFKK
jgi:large subunit ribosomal protein L5